MPEPTARPAGAARLHRRPACAGCEAAQWSDADLAADRRCARLDARPRADPPRPQRRRHRGHPDGRAARRGRRPLPGRVGRAQRRHRRRRRTGPLADAAGRRARVGASGWTGCSARCTTPTAGHCPTEHDHPAEHWLFARRWQEVEIHRVDLAGDYTPRALARRSSSPRCCPTCSPTSPNAATSPLRVDGHRGGFVGRRSWSARTWTAGDGRRADRGRRAGLGGAGLAQPAGDAAVRDVLPRRRPT